jgi:hypothetical protein
MPSIKINDFSSSSDTSVINISVHGLMYFYVLLI